LSALGASSRAVDGFTIERADRAISRLSVCARRESRIIRYGESVQFPALIRSRGSGSGQDGLAFRTGQLRSTRPRLIRLRRRFRIDRKALLQALRGPAPHGASSDGPPAPRRLEQPSPSTSPISDVLVSPPGHRLAGSRTDGKLARPTSRDVRLAFTRATETAAAPRLAERRERRSGRLPSCHAQPSLPGCHAALALWFESVAWLCAPFWLRNRRRPRQQVVRRTPGLAPRRRFALRLLVRDDARCVGPISANLSSSYQHPRLVGFRCVTCLRTCAPDSRLVHISAIGFGGPHVSRFVPSRRAFSSHRDAWRPNL